MLGPVTIEGVQMAEVFADLAMLSLGHRDPRADEISVHRLVQELIAASLSAADQCRWADRAVSAVSEALGTEPYEFTHALRLVSLGMRAVELIERWQLRNTAAARVLNWTGAHQMR